MDVIIMTVKGQKHLTRQCLRGLFETARRDFKLIIVDAGEDSERFLPADWHDIEGEFEVLIHPKMAISAAWNEGMASILKTQPNLFTEECDIWLLNNDVIFHRPVWFDLLSLRLNDSDVGMVGTSSMSLFGHPFVTGGIWGFNLANALEIAEDGRILDEQLNYSCMDVDLSIRFSRAGYLVTHVPGIEWGPDPMITHLISQTVYANEGMREVFKKREPERRRIIDKHGRKDGLFGYEGVVE